MTETQLLGFRKIAEAMAGGATDWQWIGPHASQRMFGITESRAKAFAAKHGGTATRLPEAA